ncbi:MAG: nitrogenase cofactor biosynthesis protein NifB [Victivallales bacterium]
MKDIEIKNHPCFNPEVRKKYARIHLPVAPACNVQCRFCNRRYDCANETRPGVTSAVLSPQQAIAYLKYAHAKNPDITVVGIAGPGDPMADAENTFETLKLVRREFPNILLCVATNGLALAQNVERLSELRVSHVTVTVNAVDPEIGAKVYAWIRPDKKPFRGVEGAALIWERQKEGMKKLVAAGITLKVNCIIMPGINDGHVLDVAKAVKGIGAHIMNCTPMIPAKDSEFENREQPSAKIIHDIRATAGEILPQMAHCAQCRADACGLIGAPERIEDKLTIADFAKMPLRPGENRPYVAVGTREGILVNQHLGEAEKLLIFRRGENGFEIESVRNTPPTGTGVKRWLDLADMLSDCRTVLVSGIGPSPRKILLEKGLEVTEMEGLIEEGLKSVFDGREIPAVMRRRFMGCGAACSGSGQGCQ